MLAPTHRGESACVRVCVRAREYSSAADNTLMSLAFNVFCSSNAILLKH